LKLYYSKQRLIYTPYSNLNNDKLLSSITLSSGGIELAKKFAEENGGHRKEHDDEFYKTAVVSIHIYM
jgi:hypothetical protein